MRSFYLLILSLTFCFVGCTKKEPDTWRQKNGRLKVLSTIAMIEDFVTQIGGEHVDSISLIKGSLDPHSYELVKGDDEKFLCADVIFYNGLGLEHGMSLRKHLEGNPKACAVGEILLKGDSNLLLKRGGKIDPHIWMDISLWAKTVDPIVEKLSTVDPTHASEYALRGKELREKLEEMDRACFSKLQSIPSKKRYLVTSHDAFNYFARRYLAIPGEGESWEMRAQAPEGLAPEAQASLNDLQLIVDHVVTYGIEVVFPESNVNQDSLKKIQNVCQLKGTTLRVASCHLYADSMGKEASYLDMIKHNIDAIAEELTR